MKDSERLVTVCDQCYRASCRQGEEYCDRAKGAGTTDVTAGWLDAAGFEHRSWYSKKRLREVCGQ